ncbi:MAG: PaREP1 family protein [Candidatus Caldarchaeum sp.]|nr:PaREP1 family protein [Candidatus Caldarchaeum sp.]
MKKSEEMMKQASDFLRSNEIAKASELLWGSAVSAVLAFAVLKNVRLTSHRETREFVRQLAKEADDAEIWRTFKEAEALHANFYQEFLDAETILTKIREVETFNRKIAYLVNRVAAI